MTRTVDTERHPDAPAETPEPAAGPVAPTAVAAVIAAQRSAGNQAVGRLLARQPHPAPAGPAQVPSGPPPPLPPQAAAPPAGVDAALAAISQADPVQLQAAAESVLVHRADADVAVALPSGDMTLPQADAQRVLEAAIVRRMQLFSDWRKAQLAGVPIEVAASLGATNTQGVRGGTVVPARPPQPVAPDGGAPPAAVAGAGGVPQADLDRYAAQRTLAERLRREAAPGLAALRHMTEQRADRWRHPNPEVADAVLASIQLEAVGLAEADVGAATDSGAVHDAAARDAGMSRDLNWCGFYARWSYRFAGTPPDLRAALFHVDNVEALFRYRNGDRTPARVIINGTAQELQQVHNDRGIPRQWWDADAIRAAGAALPLRPGDIVLVDNAGAPGPNHIQMVRSWDPATRMLFTIDGNGGGYVVDDRAGADTAAPASDKEARVEASTGLRLREGPAGGHVGVGAANLGDQPLEADVEAAFQRDRATPPWQEYERAHREWANTPRATRGEEPQAPPTPQANAARTRGGVRSRVYGIGRFSIMDFEAHDYTTAPAGSAQAAPRR